MPGIGVDEVGRDGARESADLVEVRVPIERDEDVQPARAGCLDERLEILPLEQFTKRERGTADCWKVVAGWIEIEDHLVGVIGLVDATEPHVRCDARLIRQVHQCRRILADHMPYGPLPLLHRGRVNPRREVRGGLLLNEPRALDPIRKPLHRHGPIAEVRQHRAGDMFVIVGELALVDALVGEEQLLRPREMHRLPPDS